MLIYTAADSNYKTQLGAMILSLKDTQNLPVDLKVIGTGWKPNDVKRLENLGTEKLSIKFYEIDLEKFSETKLSYGFTLATIYNLLAPKFIFPQLKKIIYVDADVIFTNEISELWLTDFNTSVAAVVDSHVGIVGNPSMKRPWRELGVNPVAKYLNTGLLVIDVEKWNGNDITDRCLDLLYKYEMPCIDQDALSLVLDGDFYQLSPKYNLMPFHFTPRLRYSDLVESNSSILEAQRFPSIVHFHRSYLGKPWFFGCSHPYKDLWEKYAREFNPKFKRSLNLFEFGRNLLVKYSGLTTTTEPTY